MLDKRAVHARNDGQAPSLTPLQLRPDEIHPSIRRELAAAQPGRRRRGVLTAHLADVTTSVLGTPPGAIDPAAPLATLGLTSVGMLELRTQLERSLEISLPVTLGWQFPTLDALVPYLAQRMGIELDPVRLANPVVPDRTVAPRSSLNGLEGAALDDMSDTELAALLMARIDQLEDTEA